MRRLWPRSLQGQILFAIALALLLAQAISAALLYRAQSDRREAGLVHTAAMRLAAVGGDTAGPARMHHMPLEAMGAGRRLRVEQGDRSPLRSGEQRIADAEDELRAVLDQQGLELDEVVVTHRPMSDDPRMARFLGRRLALLGTRAPRTPDSLLFAAIRKQGDPSWYSVRVPVPRIEHRVIAQLVGQTLLLYVLLIGVTALILRRITRPLAALTSRVDHFAATRDAASQIEPEGPDDIRHLIVAHNAMEARIAALLDEKNVMLGAIGHDLKTPLAALRVRIETVEDEGERARMAATIEDITRTLDDILSLARVGRSSDPVEPVELSALVAQIAEEFEDMGEPVSFLGGERLTLPARATWLRRALRNLVSNAVRYGGRARIALAREDGRAVIRIEDDGPGIPDAEIARMLEPFTRGEPSRSTETGGAGIGLTLARAIAEQHGGALILSNRRGADGSVAGLTATLALPIG